MTSKFSKRGKNPGAVDTWLDSLGYYRKNVAYDETCLFRAIAEQLFYSQLYHERVRTDCISYGRKHSKEFKYLVPKKRDWYERLKKLSVHMLVCSDIEIQLISKTYYVDITVFNAADRNVQEFKCHTLYKSDRNILLCRMSDDHYDSVYDKEYIVNAGFCQSIVYQVLYEEVFAIPDVNSIVNAMLHEKQPSFSMFFPETSSPVENSDNDETGTTDDFGLDSSIAQSSMLAPFPFKVAKALDPNMYRNIEYDTWLEVRRALRLGDWYYGDDKLILGTRCILNVEEEILSCYIQEILKEEDKCIVYITKLAERWTVKYSDLRPEDDAKPWPLPYRFARNLPIQSPNQSTTSDGERKSLRKRREKKRLNSLNENNSQAELKDINGNITDLNINNYEGYPLKLITGSTSQLMLDSPDTSTTPEKPTIKVHIPHIHNSSSETEDWNQLPNGVGSESIPLSWIPIPTNSPAPCSNYADKVSAASPSAPYRDYNGNGPMYYNYGPEYAYSSVPVWPQTHYVVSPDAGVLINDNVTSPAVDANKNYQSYVYYQAENAYAPPTILTPQIASPPSSFAPFAVPFNDRFVCSTPVTPISPHVEMYPFVYPVATPGTPVVYSPAPPPPPTNHAIEVATSVRSPLPMYTPPNDLQCVTSPTYIYPPAPPVAWYPPSVNSQGFIFPPPPTPPTLPTIF